MRKSNRNATNKSPHHNNDYQREEIKTTKQLEVRFKCRNGSIRKSFFIESVIKERQHKKIIYNPSTKSIIPDYAAVSMHRMCIESILPPQAIFDYKFIILLYANFANYDLPPNGCNLIFT